MVFRAPNTRTFKLKVAIPGRSARTFSTGATVRDVAEDVEAMVVRMKGRREWAALHAVFDGSLTLAQLYDADVRGEVDQAIRQANDTDLDPLVEEWAGGRGQSAAKYVVQVRCLIVEGERYPVSRFTRKAVSVFLAGLTCAPPTRNRYRAALSSFAKWLVEREILETNPVRDVAMYKENQPRMVWMPWTDAQRVAMAAPQPYRVLFALMAASGIELGAALKLTRADVDLDASTIHARGSKTAWRNRVVRYGRGAAVLIKAHCRGILGAAPLFPGITGPDALDTFKAAQQAVGLSGHRLHDLRHTYAVNSLRMGLRPEVVAFQLGHKDASLVHRVYGRYVPNAADYEAGSATKSATSPKKPREVKRANH